MINQDLAHAMGLSNAFRNVAEALRPSVVSISTRQTQVVRGWRAAARDSPAIPRSVWWTAAT